MKDKGVGDTIARATKATGIDKFADRLANGLNIPGGCGCKKRQDKLNKMFPYRK
jgi:hypothetical protein